MLAYHALKSVLLYLFFNFEKFGVKPGFPFTQLNQATTQNLEKRNFDMFYKNYCWAGSSVIQYAWPMCHMKEE